MSAEIVGLKAYRERKAWHGPVTPQPDRRTEREKYDAAWASQMVQDDRRWVPCEEFDFPGLTR